MFKALLWKRGANLSDDHRTKIHQWDSGRLSSDKTIEMILRLDRTDALVAQALASGDSGKSAYHVSGTDSTTDGLQATPSVPAPVSPPAPDATNYGGIQPGDAAWNYLSLDGTYDAGDDEEADDSDNEDYDMFVYDDDGEPLADEADSGAHGGHC